MNKSIFNTLPNTTLNLVRNEAGGKAYALTAEEALAQLVMTGTFNGTFYTSAETQLTTLQEILAKVNSPKFVAKLAIYARHHGFMKDTPAFLTAWLSVHAPQYLIPVFDTVIDNGKMLRNFVQIMRSGVINGRKSLGTKPKKLVQKWLNSSTEKTLIRSLVGSNPSLKDIIRMVHPKADDAMHAAMYAWLVKEESKIDSYTMSNLPFDIRKLIELRNGKSDYIPNVPFELVTNLELDIDQWEQLVMNGGWHFLRMNLNTFERKGLYTRPEVIDFIAKRLQDMNAITYAKVMPYQILNTLLNIGESIPGKIVTALNRALDMSLVNVPVIPGKTWVFVDISGSMTQSITGTRKGSTSKMTCSHIAALIASALLRNNPEDTNILMFDTTLQQSNRINPNESVMSNCEKILKFSRGGGTCCELPMEHLVYEGLEADTIIYVSDNQSWFNSNTSYHYMHDGTRVMKAWNLYRNRFNPEAKLICLDIQPYTTTQASGEDKNVFNIGGFSDEVFDLINRFVNHGDQSWISIIEQAVEL